MKGEAGYTLVEIMITLTLYSLVILAGFSLLLLGINSYKQVQEKNEYFSDGRWVMHWLVKDVRQAKKVNLLSPSRVVITILQDNGGTIQEKDFEYYIDGNGIVQRKEFYIPPFFYHSKPLAMSDTQFTIEESQLLSPSGNIFIYHIVVKHKIGRNNSTFVEDKTSVVRRSSLP